MVAFVDDEEDELVEEFEKEDGVDFDEVQYFVRQWCCSCRRPASSEHG